MLGIDTHFTYSDTVYAHLTSANPAPNGDSIISSLQTLGIRHLRDGDGQMATNPAICPAFAQAYAAGIDMDIVSVTTDTPATIPIISTCLGTALRSIEGLNELDLVDSNYASDDVTAMSLLAAARGNAFPSNTILLAPSLANTCTAYQAEATVNGDQIAAFFDYNNAHIYYSGYEPENSGYGAIPCAAGIFGAEATDLSEAQIPAPAKPVVVTETGYPDNCCGYRDPGYVSPSIKTTYLLRTILEHYTSGARYAYIYELASEQQSYGLTDQFLNPKPAYTAIENFIRILRDPGGAGIVGALRYQLSPSLQSVGQTLLKKQDGSFWLVLWQKARSWDPTANAPINVASVTGTITLGAPPTLLKLYTFDPSTGASTSAALTPGQIATLTVTDTPEILEVGSTMSPPVLATPQPPVY